MLPPLPPLPPPLVGKEDDACYTDSSPAMSAQAVCRVSESRALLDRPLPVGCVGGKGGDDDGAPHTGPHPRRCGGDKGGGRVKADVTKRAITTATSVVSDDDGDGDGGKSDGNGDEGAGRATMRAMAVATTVAAMRVASDEEGEGGNAMEMVKRFAGKQRQRQQRGQW